MDQREKQQLLTLTVKEEDFNPTDRLDQFLAKKLLDFSRSRIKALITTEKIKTNGKVSRAADKLKIGYEISIEIDSEETRHESASFQPKPLPLEILYEDEDLIVINKRAGVVIHPGVGTSSAVTLAEGVWHYLSIKAGEAGTPLTVDDEQWPKSLKIRPGVVHRLDRDTSGVIVLAKNPQAHEILAAQFKAKTNLRVYRALLFGRMDFGSRSVQGYLTRDPKERTRYISLSSVEYEKRRLRQRSLEANCKWAKSTFEPECCFGGKFTFCKITLETGRTHQIRVHAKSIGLSVIGDPVYGPKVGQVCAVAGKTAPLIKALNRQLLHAEILGFRHPTTGKDIAFTAPLPQDFQAIIDSLEELGKEG